MGKTYEWNINIFQDFLFMSLMHDVDIREEEFDTDIYMGFSTILGYVVNKEDLKFLDYEITGEDGYFKVVGNNMVTALWLSGIFPENPKEVIIDNEYILEDIKYKFNTKTNKLTYSLMKNRK